MKLKLLIALQFVVLGGMLFSIGFDPEVVRASDVNDRAGEQNPDSLLAPWRGIVPLKSTRTEVEGIFGRPTEDSSEKVTYVTPESRVIIWYSSGACTKATDKWNVPMGVVLSLEVFPRHPVALDDLKFDKSKFVRSRWSHPENWVTYSREEEGVKITTSDFGGNVEIVQSVAYGPKPSDNALRCDKKTALKNSVSR